MTLYYQVAKPRIGENHPAQVRADVTVTLSVVPSIKAEWEGEYLLLMYYHPDASRAAWNEISHC